MTVRLMAGQELVTEGFRPGQVGSSAMPHKMNTRSCERVNGLAVVLRGYASMTAELAGNQWNEGDVSCSVVRRVALPDAFFALDGLFETFLTVLDDFGAYPAVVARELDRYLPFLATTKVLLAAVRHGVGRETAHEVIKEHAVAVALSMREEGSERNDLLERLAADPRLHLDHDELKQLIDDPLGFTGRGRRSGGGSGGSSRDGGGHLPGGGDLHALGDPLASGRDDSAAGPAGRRARLLRQGAGSVRRPGRSPASRGVRPDQRVRLRPADADPRQGTDPHGPHAVVVRPTGRSRAQPPGVGRRTGRGRWTRDGRRAPRDVPRRVRGPRLSRRVRAARLPGVRLRVRRCAAAGTGRRLAAAGPDLHACDQGGPGRARRERRLRNRLCHYRRRTLPTSCAA